tara:strand:+ start:22935 stop:23381 length:447 start_codon:yes stop_codon:yes gene_type:complete
VIEFRDGYFVNELGSIYSSKARNGSLRELKGKVRRSGYREVLVTVNGVREYLLVHRVVAQAFIENPKNKRTVNHIDGNKLNNNAANLEWATDSENLKHARDSGLLKTCKITMDIAEKIRSEKGTLLELSKKYGISKTQVGYIKQGKRW